MQWFGGTHIMQPLSMWSLLAHSHSLFSLFFFFLSYFFPFLFSLIYFSLFFSSFFLPSFFSFFSARQNQHHSWYEMNLLWVLNDLPHTRTFVPYDTKSQVCDVGISKCIPPTGGTKCAVGAVLMYSCFACPSSWTWLVTKNIRGCIETDNMFLLLFV